MKKFFERVPVMMVILCCGLAAVNGWAEGGGLQISSQGIQAMIDSSGSKFSSDPPEARRPTKGQGLPGRAVAFSEDFQGGVMPAGWVVIDNDGNVVNPNISQFTEAWIVDGDFDNLTDFVAMSTSWYSPAGTSDDWLITPDIVVGADQQLSWRAEAQDAGFPDGYNVYVSTTGQTIAGCQANPTLFSIAEENGAVWTDRSVSLAAYSGQTVNICFQNDTTDRFVLMIDDVVVDGFSFDATVSSADLANEFTRMPLFLVTEVALGGTVENVGTTDLTNVVLTAEVSRDGSVVHTVSSSPIATLASGSSQVVDLIDYIPAATGVFSVLYTVTMAETDQNPANDTASAPFNLEVTVDELARDDGTVNGTLGIGDGTAGELGTSFQTGQPAILEGASFNVGPFTPPVDPGDPDIVGDTVYVNLREMVGGSPGAILATTEVYTFIDYDGHLLSLQFLTPQVLPPGDFMLGVVELDDNIRLGFADNIFTLAAGWVDYVGSPTGDWTTIESFGFNVSLMVRAVLSVPTLTVTKVGAGTGTVTSSPAGINCGGDCSEDFSPATVVNLTATPDGGWFFAGWKGHPDCLDGLVTMNSDIDCTAIFDNPIFLDGFESGNDQAWSLSGP